MLFYLFRVLSVSTGGVRDEVRVHGHWNNRLARFVSELRAYQAPVAGRI